jgi:hypothetical protein
MAIAGLVFEPAGILTDMEPPWHEGRHTLLGALL